MTFGKLILGDNQFLGVNHADQSKAGLSYEKFKEADAIIEVIAWAYDSGIRDFMFTTHQRFESVFPEIVTSKLFPEMRYIPCLPYAHKYANAIGEKGAVPAIYDSLRSISKLKLLDSGLRACIGDFRGLMQRLVDVELLMMKGLNVQGVFLQNLVFDLLMGLDARKLLEGYHSYISGSLGITPGYITMNHPGAVNLLCTELQIEKPWLCANYNVAGFRTHPSQAAVEASFSSGLSNNVAMSIFASGVLGIEESSSYISNSAGVDSVLFGSASRKNISANAKIFLGE